MNHKNPVSHEFTFHKYALIAHEEGINVSSFRQGLEYDGWFTFTHKKKTADVKKNNFEVSGYIYLNNIRVFLIHKYCFESRLVKAN